MGIILQKMKLLGALLGAAVAAPSGPVAGYGNLDTNRYCIGCSNAENGQIPWQVSMQTTGHFCGGSVVSSTYVASAGHCKQNAAFNIVAGTVKNTEQNDTFNIHHTMANKLSTISLLLRCLPH